MIPAIPNSKRIAFSLSWDALENAPQRPKAPAQNNFRHFVQQSAHTLKTIGWLTKKIWDNPENNKRRDLDLYCFCFDGQGALVETISPENLQEINANDFIFHSGEDETGEYGPDDEEVSLQLKDIPGNVQTILICVDCDASVEIDTGANAHFTLWNMTDSQVLAKHTVPFSPEKEKAYAFARLTRQPDQWQCSLVDQYLDKNIQDNPAEILAPLSTDKAS